MKCTIHPEALELVAFTRGALSPEETRRLHRHCLVCETCGNQARGLLWLRAAAGLERSYAGLGEAYAASGTTH